MLASLRWNGRAIFSWKAIWSLVAVAALLGIVVPANATAAAAPGHFCVIKNWKPNDSAGPVVPCGDIASSGYYSAWNGQSTSGPCSGHNNYYDPTPSTVNGQFVGYSDLQSNPDLFCNPDVGSAYLFEGIHVSFGSLTGFPAWKTGAASYTLTAVYNVSNVYFNAYQDVCSAGHATDYMIFGLYAYDSSNSSQVVAHQVQQQYFDSANYSCSGGAQDVYYKWCLNSPCQVSVSQSVILDSGHFIAPRANVLWDTYASEGTSGNMALGQSYFDNSCSSQGFCDGNITLSYISVV